MVVLCLTMVGALRGLHSSNSSTSIHHHGSLSYTMTNYCDGTVNLARHSSSTDPVHPVIVGEDLGLGFLPDASMYDMTPQFQRGNGHCWFDGIGAVGDLANAMALFRGRLLSLQLDPVSPRVRSVVECQIVCDPAESENPSMHKSKESTTLQTAPR